LRGFVTRTAQQASVDGPEPPEGAAMNRRGTLAARQVGCFVQIRPEVADGIAAVEE